MTPIAYMVAIHTKDNHIDVRQMEKNLQAVKNKNKSFDENMLVSQTLYNLALNEKFLKVITPSVLKNLDKRNTLVADYKQSILDIGHYPTEDGTDFVLPDHALTQPFDVNKLLAGINRNGFDLSQHLKPTSLITMVDILNRIHVPAPYPDYPHLSSIGGSA